MMVAGNGATGGLQMAFCCFIMSSGKLVEYSLHHECHRVYFGYASIWPRTTGDDQRAVAARCTGTAEMEPPHGVRVASGAVAFSNHYRTHHRRFAHAARRWCNGAISALLAVNPPLQCPSGERICPTPPSTNSLHRTPKITNASGYRKWR